MINTPVLGFTVNKLYMSPSTSSNNKEDVLLASKRFTTVPDGSFSYISADSSDSLNLDGKN